MKVTMRSMVALGVAFGLCAPLVSGCGLGVLSKAPDPDAASNTPPVKLTDCDPANLPAGCAQTCLDAQTIMQNFCNVCHETGAIGNMKNPLDYHSLSNVKASSKYPGQVYVLPGDPDRSLLYQRTAVQQDMPPPSTIDSPIPEPNISDFSVLREWILNCIPNVPGFDAGPPPSPDAGADGGGPYVYLTCPTSPPTGACSTKEMVCRYSTQTCTCDGTNWGCQACPAAQPANGSTCPTTTANGTTPVPFSCGYGNVTCDCVPSDRPQDLAPTWACGVCPAAAPSSGQACGNTSISCSYPQQECGCTGGSWECVPQSCPATQFSSGPISCAGFYSCAYPRLDQTCTCAGTATARSEMSCSCPTAPPTGGSFCQVTEAPCSYGDQTCACNTFSGWQCTQQCPATAPADGSACRSSLNCSYGAGLCYCDGTTWHCS
jgi:hypothetical protein